MQNGILCQIGAGNTIFAFANTNLFCFRRWRRGTTRPQAALGSGNLPLQVQKCTFLLCLRPLRQRRRGLWPHQRRGLLPAVIWFLFAGMRTVWWLKQKRHSFFPMWVLPPAWCYRFTLFSKKRETGCQSYTLFLRFPGLGKDILLAILVLPDTKGGALHEPAGAQQGQAENCSPLNGGSSCSISGRTTGVRSELLYSVFVFCIVHLLQFDFVGHRHKVPFYPIRFLTGNPARRCVVWLPLARSLKLKSWQASPKKYPIGRSFTFIPDTKMCLGYSDKPVDDIQSLSGKPVIIRTII